MNTMCKKGKIIIPAGVNPWPHELRVAKILADEGFRVEFLPALNSKMPDVLLNGVEYEIKSPFTNKPDKLERNIKRGLKQSKNIIMDLSRIKSIHSETVCHFLSKKSKEQKQIRRLRK